MYLKTKKYYVEFLEHKSICEYLKMSPNKVNSIILNISINFIIKKRNLLK